MKTFEASTMACCSFILNLCRHPRGGINGGGNIIIAGISGRHQQWPRGIARSSSTNLHFHPSLSTPSLPHLHSSFSNPPSTIRKIRSSKIKYPSSFTQRFAHNDNDNNSVNFFDDVSNDGGEDTTSQFQSNRKSQQSQYSSNDNPNIPSTRSLYQFRPLPPNSKRQMPPSLSDYGDADFGESMGNYENEAASTSSNFFYENKEDDVPLEVYNNSDDVERDVIARAKIIANKAVKETPPASFSAGSPSSWSLPELSPPEPSLPELSIPEPSLPERSLSGSSLSGSSLPEFSPEEDSFSMLDYKSQSTLKAESTTTIVKNSFSKFTTRATPSFLEPVKTKAANFFDDDTDTTTSISTGSNISTIENNYSNPRKIPTGASSNGSSITSQLTIISHQLQHMESQIYKLNNDEKFNINSPKQVARVLFGEDGMNESTNKDVLEAMASAGNEMAASIYKFRKLSREHKKEVKRMEQQERGDTKNDYYGNLARRDAAVRRDSDDMASDASRMDATTKTETDGNGENNKSADFEVYEAATPKQEDDLNGKLASELGLEPSTSTNSSPTHRRREPLLLIDASAYIYRSYYAIPPLHHSDGTPTGAVHGVCRMLQNLLLNRLLKGDRPRVVLAFDSKGKNFRHEVYPEYKANRGPCPEDLVPQFAFVKDAADAFGVVQVEAAGYEADDVIATLTRQALEEGVDVDILSGDKDLMQLITAPGIEPSVHMIDPMHFERVSHDDVMAKWGVPADRLGDVLALAGDSSDNIPGAPGIGPKIAALLINEYGTLSDVISQATNIKQNKRRESILENTEKILLSRQLVTLDDFVPTNILTLPPSFESVSNLRMAVFDPSRLTDFYKRMELNSCNTQLQNRLRQNKWIENKSSWTDYKSPPKPEEFKGVPF